jgi:hypothetical protein
MAESRHEPFMGPTPAFTLLVLLNAPIAFLRSFYTRHLPEVWDRVLFILAIGLFWYLDRSEYRAISIEEDGYYFCVGTAAGRKRPVRDGIRGLSRSQRCIPSMVVDSSDGFPKSRTALDACLTDVFTRMVVHSALHVWT